MKRVFVGGILAAAAVYALTYALHLLNQPSDLAVAGGYFVLLTLLCALFAAVRSALRWLQRRAPQASEAIRGVPWRRP